MSCEHEGNRQAVEFTDMVNNDFIIPLQREFGCTFGTFWKRKISTWVYEGFNYESIKQVLIAKTSNLST
jgi:hypothetical protein